MNYIRALILMLVVALMPICASAENGQPFTGFYAGAHVSYGTGTQSLTGGLRFQDVRLETNPFEYPLRGAGAGIQFGYWHQFGDSPWRVGGQISATMRGPSGQYTRMGMLAGYPAELGMLTQLDRSVDVRAQFGRVVGRFMPYGFVGVVAQHTTLQGYASVGADRWDGQVQGWGVVPIFGLGVAYELTSDWVLSAEASVTEHAYQRTYDLGGGVQGFANATIRNVRVTVAISRYF